MKNIFNNLPLWFSTKIGKALSRSFMDEFSVVKNQIYGKDFLTLCDIGNINIFPGHNFILGKDLIADLALLPIASSSLDGVFIPLTHHKIKDLKKLYFELDRVIKPGGVVVFWGINMLSFWGLSNVKRNIYFHQSLIMQHQLKIRSFELMLIKDFFNFPFISDFNKYCYYNFLNRSGITKIMFPSAFYCLVMKKTVENTIKMTYDTAIIIS